MARGLRTWAQWSSSRLLGHGFGTRRVAPRTGLHKILWESDKLWSGLDWNHLLHGDGAPFTEVDSLQVISFRCLLTKRAISESQLMIAAWPKQSPTPATGKWLAWSFRCLFEGQTPKKRTKMGEALGKEEVKK